MSSKDESIVSNPPTYSFKVEKPVVLVAAWKTKLKLSIIIAAVIIALAISAVILYCKHREEELEE